MFWEEWKNKDFGQDTEIKEMFCGYCKDKNFKII